jgi:hypothetical protein
VYILFGDETDREQGGRAPFFIYGAIFVPLDRAVELHGAIARIRGGNRFQAGDSLKFSGAELPERISRDVHREATRQVLEAANEAGVRFCAQLVSHEVARGQPQATLVEWGANTVLGAFNKFLVEQRERGMAVLDRLPIPHPDRFIRDKFQVGLRFPRGGTRPLSHIICYTHSCDGASHLASVADVVLGSFRYCVNEPERDQAPRAILPLVVQLMWHRRQGDRVVLDERGLMLRPNGLWADRHRVVYDQLLERLAALLQGTAPTERAEDAPGCTPPAPPSEGAALENPALAGDGRAAGPDQPARGPSPALAQPGGA